MKILTSSRIFSALSAQVSNTRYPIWKSDGATGGGGSLSRGFLLPLCSSLGAGDVGAEDMVDVEVGEDSVSIGVDASAFSLDSTTSNSKPSSLICWKGDKNKL